MAVRGLGCPVRLILTAGHRGDAPQAARLIEDLSAEAVIADAAYDADHFRRGIADMGATAVIPSNPSRALKHPLDADLYAQRNLIGKRFPAPTFRRPLPRAMIAYEPRSP